MGMNHTRVIYSRTGCWPAIPQIGAGRVSSGELIYRHRMVSNKPLIMKAKATA
jgi:hypothetical protein